MGGKTIGGKIVTVLLVISLSLMAWTPQAISSAFADPGKSSASAAAEGDSGGAQNAAARNATPIAPGGMRSLLRSPAAQKAPTEKPATARES